jgi:hypothetical protein
MDARIEKLPVKYPDGRLAYIATVSEVRHLVRAGLAASFGRGRYLEGCTLFSGPGKPTSGSKWSHNHETQTNPDRVWTLKPSREQDATVHVFARMRLLGNVRRSAVV